MGYLAVGSGEDAGRQIYYEHHRGTRRAVLLVHGWGTGCRAWDMVLPVLQEAGYAVVTFDQRGCGHSDKDFAEVSLESSGADAVKLLDHLKIESVVLVGWSIGGAISVAASARLGKRCAGVVSTCGATPRHTRAPDFPYGFPPNSIAAQIPVLRADRAGFLNGFAEVCYAKPVSAALKQWLFNILIDCAPCADLALADLDDLDQREILSRLDAPFLAVVGGKDLLVMPEVGRQAARIAKHGRVEEFPESGHAPFQEETARYNQVLLDFLKSLA